MLTWQKKGKKKSFLGRGSKVFLCRINNHLRSHVFPVFFRLTLDSEWLGFLHRTGCDILSKVISMGFKMILRQGSLENTIFLINYLFSHLQYVWFSSVSGCTRTTSLTTAARVGHCCLKWVMTRKETCKRWKPSSLNAQEWRWNSNPPPWAGLFTRKQTTEQLLIRPEHPNDFTSTYETLSFIFYLYQSASSDMHCWFAASLPLWFTCSLFGSLSRIHLQINPGPCFQVSQSGANDARTQSGLWPFYVPSPYSPTWIFSRYLTPKKLIRLTGESELS